MSKTHLLLLLCLSWNVSYTMETTVPTQANASRDVFLANLQMIQNNDVMFASYSVGKHNRYVLWQSKSLIETFDLLSAWIENQKVDYVRFLAIVHDSKEPKEKEIVSNQSLENARTCLATFVHSLAQNNDIVEG